MLWPKFAQGRGTAAGLNGERAPVRRPLFLLRVAYECDPVPKEIA
jgi:hypothetical protein